jgi:hypothetical protein
MPNMKAKLEHHTKVTDEYGNVLEIKVWKRSRRVYEG